jgi:CIC family chloride channel protein
MGPVSPTSSNGLGPPPRPSRFRLLRVVAIRASQWVSTTTYLQKWIVLGVVLGIIAGGGAIVFYEALKAATHLFLGIIAGYTPPTPRGEGGAAGSSSAARPWLLPVVAGVGALLGSVLVFRVAPDAEGHGTDAAISAVHHNPRGIRFRTVIVKIVASALTIGSGGSGGREGPTGQISAGFGSLLVRVLELEGEDARIIVATGIGSGIGSIFGAPLGGAVLAAEILYRDDFDPAALLPSFIASGVGYLIFASAEGFTPLFGFADSYHFTHPTQLIWFSLIGIISGLIGLAYASGFYGITAVFAHSPLPRWANPAVGAVLVGATGIAVPEVLGTGYGWIQHALGAQLSAIPLWIVLLLPVARIVATGLSIGSGGSGGVFGPGMVIGAFVGAATWRLLEPIVPSMGHDPAPYVIIGMMACFGSISRAPLAVMLMVVEMTGSVSVLAPGVVAVGLAWLIVRHTDDTMYRSQLTNRADTTAARILVGMPLLTTIESVAAMAPPRLVICDDRSVNDARQALAESGVNAAPVVDTDGHYEGTITAQSLRSADSHTPLRDLVDASAPVVPGTSHLDAALEALTAAGPTAFVPVVDNERHVQGTLSISDLVRAYRTALLANLQPAAGASTTHLQVGPGPPLAGIRLRHATLRPGVIVTSIQRGPDTITPNGDTILQPGDHLTVLDATPQSTDPITS